MLSKYFFSISILCSMHVSSELNASELTNALSTIEIGHLAPSEPNDNVNRLTAALEPLIHVTNKDKKVIYFNDDNTIAIGFVKKNEQNNDWFSTYDLHCAVAYFMYGGGIQTRPFVQHMMNVTGSTNINIWVDREDGIPRFHNGLLANGGGDAVLGPFIEDSQKFSFYYTPRYVAYEPVAGKKFTFHLNGKEEVTELIDINSHIPKKRQ